MSSRLDSSRSELAGPELRRAISDYVKRRVPPGDIEDVVQTVLCDALAAADPPGEAGELKRWVIGIARHKVADFHRRATRERPEDLADIEAQSAPLEARSMVDWAEQQVDSSGEQKKTLEWMAREGEGEKLESIAADEKLPATRIRQRVSRLRRWMRQRWSAELAAVAALVLLGVLLWRWLRTSPSEELIVEDAPPPVPTVPVPEVAPRADEIRKVAVTYCAQGDWQACLDRLDEAARLDPDGDRAPTIVQLRREATTALDERRQQEIDDAPEDGKDGEPIPSAEPAPLPPPVLNKAPPDAKSKPTKPPAKPKGDPKSTMELPEDSKLESTPQKTAPPPVQKPFPPKQEFSEQQQKK